MPCNRKGQLRRRRLSLTSLIDVIFLLLLFFMLSSTFTRFGEIDLAMAGAGAPADDERPDFLRLSGAGLTLNGAPVTLDDLGQRVDAARPLLVGLAEDLAAQGLVDVLAKLKSVPALRYRVLQ